MNKRYWLFITVLISLFACQHRTVFHRTNSDELKEIDTKNNEYTLYLIGDVGADTTKSAAALRLLRKSLEGSNQQSTGVVFLGDNLYPEGLHEKEHKSRQEDENRINAQIQSVKDFNGEVVFIPGNHDWKKGEKEGVDYVKREEDYIEKKLGRKVFKPSNGCPGPEEINLSDNLTLIVIDTQWWLHQFKKSKGEKDHCKMRTKEAFLAEFKELLKVNREKNVVVVGHHPLYSNGVHGGYFNAKDHIFPLTKWNSKLWIPLPLIGSIYPFYRSFLGDLQDIAHPKYQELKNELVTAMNEYDNVIYSAGHEHNLQYVKENSLHHIVSGSGAKKTKLRFNKRIDFGAIKKGIARIDLSKEGVVSLTFLDAESKSNEVLFQKELFQRKQRKFKLESKSGLKPSYKGLYKTVVPDSNFVAGGLKRFFDGDLNRDLWTLPIKVPYLDLHYEKGGLTPIRKGGGLQTRSLTMLGGDGKVYKIRGIKKSADLLVPRALRGTVAQDVIYDGIAGSHPYASVVVPQLADAAQIYYANPSLVYIPKDSLLGDYMEEFGGTFCLMEIHPSGDMSDYPNFGKSHKVVNYHKAIRKIEEHPKNQVDVAFTVRSRLLDILIGDWDRHDDQWRWATFKEEEKVVYRPIPRDRDQVFFQFNGLIKRIASSKWLLRKFQHFDEDIRDIAGLGFNARYFDRYFLNQADREVWESEARKLQQLITDESLKSGLSELPKEAYDYNGEELERILKKRRNKLVDFASDYYSILAKEVDVRGSLKKDFFEVIRQNNGDVEVNVYHKKKNKNERYYHRIFKKGETKEIRLYGIDNNDEYLIRGDAKKSILVRIIASEDKDQITDNSSVRGWRKMTKVYDTEGESEINTGKEASVKVLSPEDAYVFDREEFQYDVLYPLPFIGSNSDDGFTFGPRLRYIKRGFKKTPYKYFHDFYANYTTKAEGFNVNYENRYIDAWGKLAIGNKLELNRPEVFRYHGEGNETEAEDRVDVRIDYFTASTNFSLLSRNKASQLTATLGYQFANPEIENIDPTDLRLTNQRQRFFISGLSYQYLNVDNKLNPSKGMDFELGANYTRSTVNREVDFVRLSSRISLFVPVNYFKKQTTLAIRAGFATNEGDHAFYQSNFLSGLSEFRGLTRNRFAGERVFYNNIELRKSFFKVKSYIAPFDVGFLLHHDLGRVWVSSESSSLWHNSYGAGFYFNLRDYISLVGSYSISDVDETFNLGTKFYF